MKISGKRFFIILGASITAFVVIAIACIVFFVVLFHQFIPLIPKAPILLGFDKSKTYLILFQNNMELFPGGGFIGSYGIVSIDKGKLGQLTVHNVYDADGQLHKHVEPHYIMRRFSQVHQYMRDSNFDVDFAKSAENTIYMYELETGHHVDGVVAIDLSFVKSIVNVLSPIFLWQYHLTITPDNFFLQTEYHADQHSFFGSTQKQDFLHALFQSMQDKVQQNKLYYYALFVEKTLDAIQQKHLLFAFKDPDIQNIFTINRLSSTLFDPRKNKPNTLNDFLGINEANIGVNKANYFLRRSINHHVSMDSSGSITDILSITYTNTTMPNTWPGGIYKNYLRVILPLHTQLLGITINNQDQHIIPAITDFHIYEAPGFHPPAGLEVDTAQEAGKTIYGFIVPVDVKSTKVVKIMYRLADRFVVTSSPLHYNLYLFKQPGTDNDSYTFSFASTPDYSAHPLLLHTSLLTDQDVDVEIKK